MRVFFVLKLFQIIKYKYQLKLDKHGKIKC